MTKAMKKTVRRSITGSFGRYLAILLIIMLGSAFFTGLKLTRGDMVGTAQLYLERTALYDLRLLSTLGFDAEDVAAVAGCEGVLAAEGAVKTDFLWLDGDRETVLTARTLTEQVNRPDLVAGRLPEAADECVLDAERYGEERLGQTIRLASANDPDTLDAFAFREYTVVGLVRSPLYLDLDRGTSSLGDGTVNAFVLIPPEGFASEYFTELYVKGPDYPLYSEDYDAWIETLRERVETAAGGSVQARYDRLVREGEEKIADGERELADQRAEGEAELADARQELAELEPPELYLLERSESNAGYVSFESDSNIVERLSGVFPIFFFSIAALVCSTTMSRMVDDERTQIGVLRALGYGRGSILARYLIYAGSAAVLGCLLGYFGGGYLFPLVIWLAYGILYNIPGFAGEYDPVLLAVCLLVSLLCSAGVTYFCCRHEMRSAPAALTRPKAPAAGRRILLERVTFLWRRLKFLRKVSLRNIFRFKKRMIMMLLGIAGCTALLLTGFGIRDSVANTGNYQFDDIQKYDLDVTAKDPVDQALLDRVAAQCGEATDARATALLCAGEITGGGAVKSVYLVASDDPAVTDIFDLHLGDSPVAWPGQGEVVVSRKLAALAGIQAGDRVTLSLSDQEKATVTVAGLVENYVHNYVYLTGVTYAEGFGSFEPRDLLIRLTGDQDEYALAAALAGEEGVSRVSVVTDTRNRIENMMRSLNYVVALVLANAAALAFVVLFNLGNINISERAREIATLKVLGFYPRETGAYVFRENILLAGAGVLLGLPLGAALHRFVMDQIQVDIVSFKYIIRPSSVLLTAALVLLFSVGTDLILRRKIAAIDMTASLKSAE